MFKSNNFHSVSIIDMLEVELEALTAMVIAPNLDDTLRAHTAGQAMAVKSLLKLMKI